MRWLKRLTKEEAGNVLYMTVVMIMVLSIFTLVLVNTIQIAAMKIRAQQAADHMVLSVAALKARYLNEISLENSIITAYYKIRGTKGLPFATEIELVIGEIVVAAMDAHMMALNIKYNYDITHSDVLDKIKTANGLDDNFTKIAMGPIDILPVKDMMIGFKDAYVATPKPPFYHPYLVTTTYEPTNNLAVQARVEWDLNDKIIGHRLLNVSLPDLVTRARAEVYDAGVLQGPLGRYWKVRLMPPSDKVDNELKNR